MKVLVVDDSAVFRLMVKAGVERLGHGCREACDGVEAWDLHLGEPADVIISDWMMPRRDGLELCRLVRHQTGPAYAYFIVMTSRGGQEDARQAMLAGADDYLTKPLDLVELELRLIAASRVCSLHGEIADHRAALEVQNRRLDQLAHTDQLTGLGNRRAMADALEAAAGDPQAWVAMVDIDHFKSFNDAYGHAEGDVALHRVAQALLAVTEPSGRAFRYGGEELLVLGSGPAGEAAAAELPAAVRALAIPHRSSPSGVLTVSVGLARGGCGPESLKAALADADRALYEAKRTGRDRTCVSAGSLR